MNTKMTVLVFTSSTGIGDHGKVLQREIGNLGDPNDCLLNRRNEVKSGTKYRSILKQADRSEGEKSCGGWKSEQSVVKASLGNAKSGRHRRPLEGIVYMIQSYRNTCHAQQW